MRRMLAWVACLGMAAAGCGGAENKPPSQAEMKQTALSDVGELYRVYSAQYKKPPEKIADFNKMEMMSPIGLNALKTGEVVVYFKAQLPDLGEEPGKGVGDAVLAFEKGVPDAGGQVLMLNRTIRQMTPEEFKTAPKASESSSASTAAAKK